MFALHTANRTEDLFRQLTVVLEHYDPGPFEPIHFLIQGRGMERWLQMRLARHWGAAARIRFDFPQRFFAGLAQALGLRLDDAAFERGRLVWLIDEILAVPEFQEDPQLRHYLAGPGPRLRRFQLARQLAQLFDQYQIQRRDWLAAWVSGECVGEPGIDPAVERWQAALWRRLHARLGGHRGELWEALIAALRRSPTRDALPPAVHLFGISFLPPLMMDVLAALAGRSDVHLYLLTPTEGYWADLPGKRRQAQARLEGEAPDIGHHPLLVALGRRGAQFQRLILDCVEPALESSVFPRHDPPANLLQHLQNDLAEGVMTGPPPGLPVGIEWHRCHTPLREVEVARDRILAALADDPGLRLEDIAVMAPDIGVYQPYLEAVFADLPHHIADRSLGRSNPLLEVLAEALALLSSRFEWEAVLELLGRAPVRERFGISAAQLPALESWVQAAAIRWGLDADQRALLGLPASEYNSWRLGVDRMLLGWMADLDGDWQGVVPFAEVEGQAGEALLRLADFVHLLQRWWQRWQHPQTLADWRAQLLEFSAALLADTPETCAARQALAELLDTLPAADYHLPVDLTVMLDWLRSRVIESVSDDFLSGGITCCTLLPMRVVPFRLTVILGLDDGAFPRREVRPAYDLLAACPRLGDRDVRLEQRYQFLEVLLSTRERLILTCQGLTPEKNESRPPAQVVVELGEVLRRYGVGDADWIVAHPSHPFHPCDFEHDPPPDPERYPVAEALLRRGTTAVLWPRDFALDDPPPTRLELAELLEFHADPQAWFCRERLQLAMLTREALPEPREPFDVDGLTAWRMKRRILQALEAGEKVEGLLERAQRAGEWPQGEVGMRRFQVEKALVEALHRVAARCRATLGGARAGEWQRLEIDGVVLEGRPQRLYEKGQLIVQVGRLNGKRFFEAWLQHLFVQGLGAYTTWLIAQPPANSKSGKPVQVCRFGPVAGDFEARLAPWLRHFLDHWNRPSPWHPVLGYAWWREQGKEDIDAAEAWRKVTAKQKPDEPFRLLFGPWGIDRMAAQACDLYPRLVNTVTDVTEEDDASA